MRERNIEENKFKIKNLVKTRFFYKKNMKKENLKIFYLKNLDIYNWIWETEWFMKIAKNSCDYSKSKNQEIYSPKKEDQNIYVLKKWEIELYHFKNWKKIIFDTLTPWDVFWNFESENPYPTHFAVCSRDCYICTTPLDEFLMVVSKHPNLILNLMQKMANRIKDYEQKIEIWNFSAEDRIIYELKRLKIKKSTNFFGQIFDIPLRITHKKISDLTFLNRVTVTKIISKLSKEWKIKLDKKTWAIEIL